MEMLFVIKPKSGNETDKSRGDSRLLFKKNILICFISRKEKTLNNETPCQDSSLVPANRNALWFLQIQPGYLESHRGAQEKPENGITWRFVSACKHI